MTNKELQALRRLFFLDVKEAATYVAGHSTPRTWQKYEQGTATIPDDVKITFSELAKRRMATIEEVENLMTETGADSTEIHYYKSFKEYSIHHRGSTVVDWRLSQAIAAYFFAEGLAKLK